MTKFLMQMRPFFGQEEREALIAYDFEDGFLTEFRETVKFESQLMKYLGVENVAAVNNGTVRLLYQFCLVFLLEMGRYSKLYNDRNA